MERGKVVLALLAVALVGAGCGERAEPVGVLAPSYPVQIIGAGGRATVLRAAPERIVALDAGPAALLVKLGAGRTLVGVPVGFRLARGTTKVARASGQVDVEAVVRLRPDLIVATSATDPLDASRAARKTHAPLYLQPASSLEDVFRGVLGLGSLTGRPVGARRFVRSLRHAVRKVEARLADVPPVTVFVDTGFFITVGERSLLGDLVRRAKGRSVAGKAPGPEPFDLRRLARLDPDVYLATTGSRVTLARLRANPRTRKLTAVKRGRFALVPGELVTEPGPRLPRALATVARALHPDAFE